MLNLLDNMGISNIFNIEDLSRYHSQNDTSTEGPLVHFKSTSFMPFYVEIEDIVDANVVKEGSYKKYLVK